MSFVETPEMLWHFLKVWKQKQNQKQPCHVVKMSLDIGYEFQRDLF